MKLGQAIEIHAPDYVADVAKLLRHLAESGVIDRAQRIRVGNISVSLGPAELPAEIAKGDPSDPRTRLKRMIHEHLNIKGGE